MNRALIPSEPYVRQVKKVLKANPEVAASLERTLTALGEDAFAPQLKTHKLRGKLAGWWSSSVGYDMRVVYRFVEYKGVEAILLLSIGTHDQVY